MERRLLKAITTPAMIVTLLAGITLATTQAQWRDGWLHAKLLLVAAACWPATASWPRMCAVSRPTSGPRSATWYRVFNEVPTLLFIGIVLLAVLKPF